MINVRPKVTDLVFQLYGRALHPELFHLHRSQRIERKEYDARIEITSSGHLVTWRYAGLTLTEVATSAHASLPERRRLFSHRLRGRRCDQVECRGRASYKTDFQLEVVEPDVFWAFQEELAWDGEQCGLLHRFDSGGRIALGALSYVHVEPRRKTLLVHAFHTFPNDCAVVKTQSLFEIP